MTTQNNKHDKRDLIYANNAVISPRAPYADDDMKLDCGDMLIICGNTPAKGKGFSINLLYDRGTGKKDTIFHLNPRFSQKELCRNTYVDQQWGPEEKSGLGLLKPGHHFECAILVKKDVYKVAFNKKHLFEYKHRLPYESINAIEIGGELTLDSLHVQRNALPKHVKGNKKLAIMPELNTQNVLKEKPSTPTDRRMPVPIHVVPDGYILDVPFVALIPGGMDVNRTIYISGVPQKFARMFAVNLKVGHHNNSDIAFHLTVKFDNNRVVCNTLTNGKWGKEKVLEGNFPFSMGVHFDMQINCGADAFLVSVNNEHFVQYYHRVKDLKSVDTLNITDDVNLVHIRLQ